MPELLNIYESVGYDVTHLWLEQHSIHDNGHILASEKNSDDIAALNEERLTVVLPPSVLALPLLADLTLMEIIL